MKKNEKKLQQKRMLQRILQLSMLLVLLFLTGCGEAQVSVMKSREAQDTGEADETAGAQDTGKTDETAGAQEQEDTEDESAEEPQIMITESPQSTVDIYVDVGGAVNHPGVYRMESGSRVFQALELAGGVTEEADVSCLNQAEIVRDGQQIRVYTKEETEEMKTAGQQPYPGTADVSCGSQGDEDEGSQKVNINLADKEELMTLNGIGAAKAEQIIAYRLEHDGFKSVEELMQIDGIKEKTFNKLRDKITIN